MKKGSVIDITGYVFGRLLVISYAGQNARRISTWVCKCDCGEIVVINKNHLNSGITQSCGCLQREKARGAGDRTRTHGLSTSPVYAVWDSMIQRCHNPSRKDFPHYGGRGIQVCDKWRKFENFLSDMGQPPKGMSLERIDVNRGYSLDNCTWIPKADQYYNRTDTKYLEIDGVKQPLGLWAKQKNLKYRLLSDRVRRGWPVEKLFIAPLKKGETHVLK